MKFPDLLPYDTPGRLYHPDEMCRWCGKPFHRAHSREQTAEHIARQVAKERGVEFDGKTVGGIRDVEHDAYEAWRIKVTTSNPSGPVREPAKGIPTAARAAAEVPFRDRLAIKRMEAARQREAAALRETKTTTKAERVNPYKVQVGKRDPLPDLGPYKVTVPEGKDGNH
jgi:hypothetical protein